jgi:hypothetical protein
VQRYDVDFKNTAIPSRSHSVFTFYLKPRLPDAPGA